MPGIWPKRGRSATRWWSPSIPTSPCAASKARCALLCRWPRGGRGWRGVAGASLACVDYIAAFATRTPVPLIEQVRPAIYAKGGDYREEDLPEARVVRGYGGDVRILSLVAGRSTTNIIARVCAAYGQNEERT